MIIVLLVYLNWDDSIVLLQVRPLGFKEVAKKLLMLLSKLLLKMFIAIVEFGELVFSGKHTIDICL